MVLNIEFLAQFDKAVIINKEYDALEKLFVKPVMVSRGEVVARVLESGKVYSHDMSGVMYLVPDGKQAKDLVGDNLSLSGSEPLEIRSSIDGCMCAMDGVLKVTVLMELFGDVGRKTGDIISRTSVKIHGGVMEGFKVLSRGDVEVLDIVEGADVEAYGKAILKGGIVGTGEGASVVGGEIYAKFAQACKLESKGSITIDGPAMNCELVAARKVTLKGESSALVGGVTRAREEVSVSKAGSQGALPTKVYVGYDPFAVKRKSDREGRTNALSKLRGDRTKEMSFALESLGEVAFLDTGDIFSFLFYLSDMIRSGDTDNFNKGHGRAFKKLSGTILSIIRIDGELKKIETEESEDVLGLPFAKAQVKISNIAHPGVKISILEDEITLDHECECVRFILDEGKIKEVGI